MHQWVTSIKINKLENIFLKNQGVELHLKREDLIHPLISGNKWRKLKYNLIHCINNKLPGILTFGGAHSNHIAATAAAGKKYNLKTVGVIRGDYFKELSPTLNFAKQNGMELIFIDTASYKKKESFIPPKEFENYWVIPEGGANEEGLKGTMEIIDSDCEKFDEVFCAVGTGNTLTGIVLSSYDHQNITGINVLKGEDSTSIKVKEALKKQDYQRNNWLINNNYHLGGYAKNHSGLVEFIQNFKKEFNIQLDPVYTGKMMYAVWDLIEKGQLKNKKILCIHTGGLQGIEAFEKRYNTIINVNN